MCLIIASPTGKPVSKEILVDAANRNRDGGGVAWLEKEPTPRIEFRKGLDADEAYEILSTEAKDKAWVAHFRIQTVGGARAELTHPFTIDEACSVQTEGHAPSVLFHNGMMGDWKQWLLQAVAGKGRPIPAGPWSDTRAMAYIAWVYGKNVIGLLDSSSRYLVFDANAPSESRMMLWGDWTVKDGLKFSNTHCEAFYGGSRGNSNFRKPAESSEEKNSEVKSSAAGSTTEEAKTSSSLPKHGETSMGLPSTANVSTNNNSHRKSRPRLSLTATAADGLWKRFTDAGLVVKAENEPLGAI